LTPGGEPTNESGTGGAQDDADDANGDMTVDFGFFQPLDLGDTVWYDYDGNGVQDGGEPGIQGVTVELFDANGNSLGTDVTDANGMYLFPDLAPGTYTVVVDDSTIPGNFQQTYDDDGLGSPNESTTTLTNADDLDQDFGYQPLMSIGSTVFIDYDDNGIQDQMEMEITSLVVLLLVITM